MASLYIKDQEAAVLAAEVAALRGVTKTVAVKDALRKERNTLRGIRECSGADLLARLARYREQHPLPPPTGLSADKTFFDGLWGEE